jgi:signal-transduction protein with cAMP-binding, CBS, and nucleotidyltransferase domain
MSSKGWTLTPGDSIGFYVLVSLDQNYELYQIWTAKDIRSQHETSGNEKQYKIKFYMKNSLTN